MFTFKTGKKVQKIKLLNLISCSFGASDAWGMSGFRYSVETEEIVLMYGK